MIKFIHTHKQSIRIVFLVIAGCFAVSGVGVSMFGGDRDALRHAIRINDTDYSYGEVEQAERRIEDQYQRMFGENYAMFAQSLNIRQQAVDQIIDGHLMQQEGQAIGFTAGDEEVKRFILTKVFDPRRGGGSFSPEAYRGMLQAMGMSAGQFESEIRKDIVRSSLAEFLGDVAYVNDADVRARMTRQDTKYTFAVGKIDPKALISEVPTPSDTDLQKYFEANATEYELPARVSYDYIVLAPEDFKKEVQVLPQDIELYYSENQGKYAIPEQVHVRAIKLLYPKDPEPAKMAAVRERATKAHDDAVAGKPFAALVTQYSDDIPSKATGGDRGWISKSASPDPVAKAAFATEAGSISEVIETDYGFEIVKVEEKKAAGQRSLEDTKAEIEAEIRGREAPGYAAAKAHEVIENAKKSGAPLADVAKSAGLTVASTNGVVSSGSDPDARLAGITERVIQLPNADRTTPNQIDIGELAVIVQVKEYKDPTTPAFEEAKEKVLTSYKAKEARKLAEERAAAILETMKAKPETDFKAEVASKKGVYEAPVEISRANPSPANFKAITSDMRTALFATKANSVVGEVFNTPEGFIVAKVLEIKKPDLSAPDAQKEMKKYRAQAQQELAKNLVESTLAQLKANAVLEVDPSLQSR